MFFDRRLLKRGLLLVLMSLLFALPFLGTAEEGTEITAQCRITASGSRKNWQLALDRKFKTTWGRSDAKAMSITVDLPEAVSEGGLYLCFAVEPEGLELYGDEDEIPFFSQGKEGYAHRYIPFEGRASLRLVMWGEKGKGFELSEFYVLSGAQPPVWVQRWEEPLERADLLVLVAHPDDELLWMGGAIPYYSMERGMDVTVAYMTCANPLRRSEMLNGLWTAGVRHYPYIGQFRDKRVSGLKESYRIWGGQEKVEEHVVALLRKLRPQVVLSHDVKGEYGHPAHVITSRAAVAAAELAADAKQFSQSAEAFGTWDVPKLYLHLYKENAIEMNWEQPFDSMNGATPLEVARKAFDQHRSQRANYSVEIKGPYSAARFGLARSLVGEDLIGNDLFENIEEIPVIIKTAERIQP